MVVDAIAAPNAATAVSARMVVRNGDMELSLGFGIPHWSRRRGARFIEKRQRFQLFVSQAAEHAFSLVQNQRSPTLTVSPGRSGVCSGTLLLNGAPFIARVSIALRLSARGE